MLGSVLTEYQARFIVTSIRMLTQWSQQNSPITKIRMNGLLVGHDQNGNSIELLRSIICRGPRVPQASRPTRE